jgi:hypothetical protein
LFQDRSHRKGAQHHRRVWPLPLLARIAIRITVRSLAPVMMMMMMVCGN